MHNFLECASQPGLCFGLGVRMCVHNIYICVCVCVCCAKNFSYLARDTIYLKFVAMDFSLKLKNCAHTLENLVTQCSASSSIVSALPNFDHTH